MTAEITPLGVGLHDGIPSERYHADPCPLPSLSSGVVRKLIDETPAHAYLEHVRLGGRKTKPSADMILGQYVHGLLGADLSDFEVGVFDDYKSKVAQTWRDGVEAAGKTPVLEKTTDRARKIEKSLRSKVSSWNLTNCPLTAGKPEVTAIWQEDGFWFRARFDRLILDPALFADVFDWKTTGVGVSAHALERVVIDQGYHIQAAFYLRGLRALAPKWRGRETFTLVFVETDPPFAVRRVSLSAELLGIANRQLNRAILVWKGCLASNEWPDGSDEAVEIHAPAWLAHEEEEVITASSAALV